MTPQCGNHRCGESKGGEDEKWKMEEWIQMKYSRTEPPNHIMATKINRVDRASKKRAPTPKTHTNILPGRYKNIRSKPNSPGNETNSVWQAKPRRAQHGEKRRGQRKREKDPKARRGAEKNRRDKQRTRETSKRIGKNPPKTRERNRGKSKETCGADEKKERITTTKTTNKTTMRKTDRKRITRMKKAKRKRLAGKGLVTLQRKSTEETADAGQKTKQPRQTQTSAQLRAVTQVEKHENCSAETSLRGGKARSKEKLTSRKTRNNRWSGENNQIKTQNNRIKRATMADIEIEQEFTTETKITMEPSGEEKVDRKATPMKIDYENLKLVERSQTNLTILMPYATRGIILMNKRLKQTRSQVTPIEELEDGLRTVVIMYIEDGGDAETMVRRLSSRVPNHKPIPPNNAAGSGITKKRYDMEVSVKIIAMTLVELQVHDPQTMMLFWTGNAIMEAIRNPTTRIGNNIYLDGSGKIGVRRKDGTDDDEIASPKSIDELNRQKMLEAKEKESKGWGKPTNVKPKDPVTLKTVTNTKIPKTPRSIRELPYGEDKAGSKRLYHKGKDLVEVLKMNMTGENDLAVSAPILEYIGKKSKMFMEQEEVIIPMSELMEYIADIVDGRDDIRHRIHMAAHMLMSNLAARGAKPKGGDEDKQELKERIVYLKKNVEALNRSINELVRDNATFRDLSELSTNELNNASETIEQLAAENKALKEAYDEMKRKDQEVIKSLEEEREVAQARIDTLVFENGELMENMDKAVVEMSIMQKSLDIMTEGSNDPPCTVNVPETPQREEEKTRRIPFDMRPWAVSHKKIGKGATGMEFKFGAIYARKETVEKINKSDNVTFWDADEDGRTEEKDVKGVILDTSKIDGKLWFSTRAPTKSPKGGDEPSKIIKAKALAKRLESRSTSPKRATRREKRKRRETALAVPKEEVKSPKVEHVDRVVRPIPELTFNEGFIKDNMEPGDDIEKQTAENVNQEVPAAEQSNEKKMEGDMEEPKP